MAHIILAKHITQPKGEKSTSQGLLNVSFPAQDFELKPFIKKNK